MNVYHVFATFTDPDDYLAAVFGSPTLGPLVVGSSNGGPFYENDGAPGDTFFTIGLPIFTPPDVPGFIVGSLYTDPSGGLFTPGPIEQGRAGYIGDGDPLLRVLIFQLTCSSTSSVRGTVNISGINNLPFAGGQAFTVSGQTFGTVPAPGAMPLAGFALWRGARRRQCLRPQQPN